MNFIRCRPKIYKIFVVYDNHNFLITKFPDWNVISLFFTGRGVLVKDVTGKEVEIEGVAAPPLQQVVVLNPEQSAQELVSILIDELQKYEDRHQCSSLHYTYVGSFFDILVCGRYLFSKSCTSNTHTHPCTPTHPHNYTHTPPTYTPHTPHTPTHTYTHTHTHIHQHTYTYIYAHKHN